MSEKGCTEQRPLLEGVTIPPAERKQLPLSHFVDQVLGVYVTPKMLGSIREIGQIVPVVALWNGNRWELADGRRRVRALMLLAEEAGVPLGEATVTADTRDVSGWPAHDVLTLTTNSVRTANIVSELAAIERLLAEGYSEKEISSATGMDPATLAKRLNLRSLSPALRKALEDGRMAPGVASKAANLLPHHQAILEKKLEADGGSKRITGSDVRAARMVSVVEALELWPADALDTPGADEAFPPSVGLEELTGLRDMLAGSPLAGVKIGPAMARQLARALDELISLYQENELPVHVDCHCSVLTGEGQDRPEPVTGLEGRGHG